MKIIVDQEAAQMIRQLCDIGLKAGGIQNLQGILSVLNSMKIEDPIPPQSKEEENKDGK